MVGRDDIGFFYPGLWDDLRFPATRVRLGALNKPDFDYTNLGLLFPQNDTAEKIYVIGQMPHEYRLKSTIKPHIHYIQSDAVQPTFIMEYRIYKNGTAVPALTSLSTADGNKGVFTYPGSGSILQIAAFPEINMSAIDAVSAMFDIIVYRNDNDVTGDVLFKEFDIHVFKDSSGSRQEYIK